jgi:hypothetical protein
VAVDKSVGGRGAVYVVGHFNSPVMTFGSYTKKITAVNHQEPFAFTDDGFLVKVRGWCAVYYDSAKYYDNLRNKLQSISMKKLYSLDGHKSTFYFSCSNQQWQFLCRHTECLNANFQIRTMYICHTRRRNAPGDVTYLPVPPSVPTRQPRKMLTLGREEPPSVPTRQPRKTLTLGREEPRLEEGSG